MIPTNSFGFIFRVLSFLGIHGLQNKKSTLSHLKRVFMGFAFKKEIKVTQSERKRVLFDRCGDNVTVSDNKYSKGEKDVLLEEISSFGLYEDPSLFNLHLTKTGPF